MIPFLSDSSPKRKALSVEMNRGIFLLLCLISLIFLFLAWFSVSYHNKNATNGYRLQKLEQDREVLMTQIEILEMNIADKSALSVLNEESDEDTNDIQIKPKIIYLK